MKKVSILCIKNPETEKLVTAVLKLYDIETTKSPSEASVHVTDMPEEEFSEEYPDFRRHAVYVSEPIDISLFICSLRRTAEDSKNSPDFDSNDEKPIISEEQKSITYRGSTVFLTDTELDLFIYLYNRRGTNVSRAELTKNVWKSTSDSSTNLVDVYISYLRKKCAELFGPAFILSVRGKGYTMNLR